MRSRGLLIISLAIILGGLAPALLASGTSSPAIASVTASPVIAASGDMVSVKVAMAGGTAVSSVTANALPLRQTSTATWEGYVPAGCDAGSHTISVVATDSTGINCTDSSATYLTVPIVGIRNRDAASSSARSRSDKTLFRLWGKATFGNESAFDLDDGSGCPIHVVSPGHIVRTGDYVTARGQLVTSDSGVELQASEYDIAQYAPGDTITAEDLILGYHLQRAANATLAKQPSGSQVTVALTSLDPGRLLLGCSASPTPSRTVSVNAPGVSFTALGLAASGVARIAAVSSDGQRGLLEVHLRPTGFVFFGGPDYEGKRYGGNLGIGFGCVVLDPVTHSVDDTVTDYSGLGFGLPDVSVEFVNSDPAIASIVTNPVVLSGYVSPHTVISSNVSLSPLQYGSTTLSLKTPAGFTTPTEQQQITVNVVEPRIKPSTNVAVGRDLQIAQSVLFETGPSAHADITVTAADSSIAAVTSSPGIEGSGTVTLTGASNGSQYYLQGRNTGATTVTLSSPGYQPTSYGVAVDPSGFLMTRPNIVANKYAANSGVMIQSARLVTGTLKFAEFQSVRGGMTVNVPVWTSDPAVGVITNSPVAFGPNVGTAYASFDPVDVGTCNISIGTPAGFERSVDSVDRTATVNSPKIVASWTSVAVGYNLQAVLSVQLESAPPQPVDLAASLDDNSLALVSTSSTAQGSASATFAGVATTSRKSFYVQGLSVGQTSIRLSASGYADTVIPVSIYPSGFVFSGYGSTISTTTLSANTSLTLASGFHDPKQYGVVYQSLRPGADVAYVTIDCSNIAVGSTTVNPVAFFPGIGTSNTAFDPVSQGTCTLSIVQPPGYQPPTDGIVAMAVSVTPPYIVLDPECYPYGGVDLQNQLVLNLTQAPTSAVSVTAVVADSSILSLSTIYDQLGGASATKSISSTSSFVFYCHGRTQGSTTVQVSAPGYVTNTIGVSIRQSGFGFVFPGANTVSLAKGNRTIPVCSGVLDSGSLERLPIRAGLGTLYATAACSDPSVGTITGSPLYFNQAADEGYLTFAPKSVGTCDIWFTAPTGWSAFPGFGRITMTVTP